MTLVHLYITLFSLTFVICSLIVIIEDGSFKEVLTASALNIFLLASWLFYKLVKKLAILKMTKRIGREPVTVKDWGDYFSDYGLPKTAKMYSMKGFISVLITKNKKKKVGNNING